MLAQPLARVFQIAELTDIPTAKWIKEINSETEKCVSRQGILNKNEEEVPLNYKLFKGILSVKMDLVFVSNNLAVPRSLREWVIQVAHGHHLGADKMEHLTESVYWPGKTNDLREKAANCLTCFHSSKNLKIMLPFTEKKPPERANFRPEEIQLDFSYFMLCKVCNITATDNHWSKRSSLVFEAG